METNIIQLIVIPFCRVCEVVQDTKRPLKSYLWSDNPNGFSFSNYQQVFINFRKIKYFDFYELIINVICNNWSRNSNLLDCVVSKISWLLSLLCNDCMNITKVSLSYFLTKRICPQWICNIVTHQSLSAEFLAHCIISLAKTHFDPSYTSLPENLSKIHSPNIIIQIISIARPSCPVFCLLFYA